VLPDAAIVVLPWTFDPPWAADYNASSNPRRLYHLSINCYDVGDRSPTVHHCFTHKYQQWHMQYQEVRRTQACMRASSLARRLLLTCPMLDPVCRGCALNSTTLGTPSHECYQSQTPWVDATHVGDAHWHAHVQSLGVSAGRRPGQQAAKHHYCRLALHQLVCEQP
jgi:hypothetical protein